MKENKRDMWILLGIATGMISVMDLLQKPMDFTKCIFKVQWYSWSTTQRLWTLEKPRKPKIHVHINGKLGERKYRNFGSSEVSKWGGYIYGGKWGGKQIQKNALW